jgi:hypothetical protein
VADTLAPPPAEAAEDASEARGRRPSVLVWIALAVVAVALAAGIAAVAASSGGPDTVEYVVPDGTAQELDAGDVVEVLPTLVHLEAGQALQLDNRDTRLHVVGPLRAEAGETTRQIYDQEGRYVLSTSLRSDGLVTILVEDPDSDSN